ncbi:hypothetical protein CEUSTIGMA_g4004.t1 [Chlamydomonas eustigma]|uniref:MYND-type domain-containing protein n=1 Tax=Chlamydomonas eustigma TaxID=1157962 RepID=A0A250X0G0_9CHLO|nr:hypothetical protein CEUSTIGMA_g4004.t1 [Chlamydomonas eustigma]|eukprot:GAX76558.1 hypothetical protein CEUSTIGMA_g4004.t1 [Chlamydomonas eustigma]
MFVRAVKGADSSEADWTFRAKPDDHSLRDDVDDEDAPLREDLTDFWIALRHDQDGLPLIDKAQAGAIVDLRQNYEEVLQDLIQFLTRVLVDAVLPAHADDRSDESDIGLPTSVAHVVDTLIMGGILRALEWVFSNELLSDQMYSSTTATLVKGGARAGTGLAFKQDVARLCAAQLVRSVFSARPQQASLRTGGYLLRSIRKFINARVQLHVLNSYCVNTLLELAEILLPLPGLGAEMAGLDVAPVPGNLRLWIPEQSKLLGSGLIVVHTWAPFMNLIMRLIPTRSRACIRLTRCRKRVRIHSNGGVRFNSNPASLASPVSHTVPNTPLGGRGMPSPLSIPSSPFNAKPAQLGANSMPGSPFRVQPNTRLIGQAQPPLLPHGSGCQLPDLAAEAAEEAAFDLAFERKTAMMGRQQRMHMRKAQRDALRSGDVTKALKMGVARASLITEASMRRPSMLILPTDLPDAVSTAGISRAPSTGGMFDSPSTRSQQVSPKVSSQFGANSSRVSSVPKGMSVRFGTSGPWISPFASESAVGATPKYLAAESLSQSPSTATRVGATLFTGGERISFAELESRMNSGEVMQRDPTFKARSTAQFGLMSGVRTDGALSRAGSVACSALGGSSVHHHNQDPLSRASSSAWHGSSSLAGAPSFAGNSTNARFSALVNAALSTITSQGGGLLGSGAASSNTHNMDIASAGTITAVARARIVTLSNSTIATVTARIFKSFLQQLYLLSIQFSSMEPLQVALDITLSNGNFCDLLLLIIKGGHYTLQCQQEDEDDPYFDVLMKIAIDLAAYRRPTSKLKQGLSIDGLSFAVKARNESQLDKRFGLKGLSLISLEELLCLVHVSCSRPHIAVKLISSGVVDALAHTIITLHKSSIAGEVARVGLLLLGLGSCLQTACCSVGMRIAEMASEKLLDSLDADRLCIKPLVAARGDSMCTAPAMRKPTPGAKEIEKLVRSQIIGLKSLERPVDPQLLEVLKQIAVLLSTASPLHNMQMALRLTFKEASAVTAPPLLSSSAMIYTSGGPTLGKKESSTSFLSAGLESIRIHSQLASENIRSRFGLGDESLRKRFGESRAESFRSIVQSPCAEQSSQSLEQLMASPRLVTSSSSKRILATLDHPNNLMRSVEELDFTPGGLDVATQQQNFPAPLLKDQGLTHDAGGRLLLHTTSQLSPVSEGLTHPASLSGTNAQDTDSNDVLFTPISLRSPLRLAAGEDSMAAFGGHTSAPATPHARKGLHGQWPLLMSVPTDEVVEDSGDDDEAEGVGRDVDTTQGSRVFNASSRAAAAAAEAAVHTRSMYYGPTMIRREGKVVNLLDLKEIHQKLALKKQLELEQQWQKVVEEEVTELARHRAVTPKASIVASSSQFTESSTTLLGDSMASKVPENSEDGHKGGGGSGVEESSAQADNYVLPEQVSLPEQYRNLSDVEKRRQLVLENMNRKVLTALPKLRHLVAEGSSIQHHPYSLPDSPSSTTSAAGVASGTKPIGSRMSQLGTPTATQASPENTNMFIPAPNDALSHNDARQDFVGRDSTELTASQGYMTSKHPADVSTLSTFSSPSAHLALNVSPGVQNGASQSSHSRAEGADPAGNRHSGTASGNQSKESINAVSQSSHIITGLGDERGQPAPRSTEGSPTPLIINNDGGLAPQHITVSDIGSLKAGLSKPKARLHPEPPLAKKAVDFSPLVPDLELFLNRPKVPVLNRPKDIQWLDPDRLNDNMLLTQVVLRTLAELRSLISSLPGCDMHDLCREKVVLGCQYLGCHKNRGGGVPEADVLFRACEECSKPRYCSKECADAAFWDHHYVYCHWRTDQERFR